MFCFLCIREVPAHDLVRVSIRHYMQIATIAHQIDVRDIAHPQLVRSYQHEATDEFLVPVIAMVRVRRVMRFETFLRQLEVAQQLLECIASLYPVAKEHALEHQPKLVIADAQIHIADLLHSIYDAHHAKEVFIISLLLLVIALIYVCILSFHHICIYQALIPS